MTVPAVAMLGVGVCSRFSTAHTSSSASTFSRSGDDGTSSISTLPRRVRLPALALVDDVGLLVVVGDGMVMDGAAERLLLLPVEGVVALGSSAEVVEGEAGDGALLTVAAFCDVTGTRSDEAGADAGVWNVMGMVRMRMPRSGDGDEATEGEAGGEAGSDTTAALAAAGAGLCGREIAADAAGVTGGLRLVAAAASFVSFGCSAVGLISSLAVGRSSSFCCALAC